MAIAPYWWIHFERNKEEVGPMLQALGTSKPLRRPNNEADRLAKKKERLLEIIKAKSLLKGGPFKLASGAMTDYYLDMKPTTFDPEGSSLISEIVHDMLRDDNDVVAIGGLELGCVPI